jgi:hypothetical protein
MSTPAHTPTLALALPLRGAASHFKNNIHFICIVDAKERVLVSSIEAEIGRAIVRACNSHAGLVAALEQVVFVLEDEYQADACAPSC